jgi:radical SAM protein with 4Fe4S-binding SPASM domain
VILGPSDFAGQMVDVAVADMAPPRRRACGRLWSRLSILCDGRVVSCEQDVLGRQTLGTIGEMSLKQMWKERFGALRGCHRVGAWDRQPLCGTCREWHRP